MKMHILIWVKYMYLLYYFLGFFAIFGIILVIKAVVMAFLRVNDTCCSTNILLIIKNSYKNHIEFETKIALLRLRWYNISRYDNVYVVGCGLSEENFRICKEICRKSDVELLEIKEFSEMLMETGVDHELRKIES